MDTLHLEKHFERIGARAVVSLTRNENAWGRGRRSFRIDIGTDREGEYFYLNLPEADQDAQVLNSDKRDRHLVLLVKDGGIKSKFLCGHDERHWFVAAIPEKERVSTVAEAKEALKPKELPKFRPWHRQGEWFFVPRPEFHPPRGAVFAHNEPLVRRTSDGRGGKPHMVTEAYRHGGEQVYVHSSYAPQGMLLPDFDKWLKENPKLAKHKNEFRGMKRNAKVYVRGEVHHPDHYTLKLGVIWHEVLMNRESESVAMKNMVFLD